MVEVIYEISSASVLQKAYQREPKGKLSVSLGPDRKGNRFGLRPCSTPYISIFSSSSEMILPLLSLLATIHSKSYCDKSALVCVSGKPFSSTEVVITIHSQNDAEGSRL
jgi:hypothetical protein